MHTTVALANPKHHQSGTEIVSILMHTLRTGQASHILFMRVKVRLFASSHSPPHLTGLHHCCLLNASYYQTTSKLHPDRVSRTCLKNQHS
jgi:hypothetical protein